MADIIDGCLNTINISAECIGEGSFGRVRNCTVNGKKYVAKVITEDISKVLNECVIGSSIDHPNVNKSLSIIHRVKYANDSEYSDKVLLLQKKAKCDSKKMPCKDNYELCMKLVFDTLCGLRCLHSNGIVHGDIKCQNILYFKEENIFKIADFSLSSIEGTNKSGIVCGKGYTPPEILSSRDPKRHIIPSLDIWCVGYMLHKLYFGCYMHSPKSNDNDLTRTEEIRDISSKVTRLKDSNSVISKLIYDCMMMNPNERLSCEQLLTKYFSDTHAPKFYKMVPVLYTVPDHLNALINRNNGDNVYALAYKILSSCIPIVPYLGESEAVIGCDRIAFQFINQSRRIRNNSGKRAEVHIYHYLSFQLLFLLVD